MTTREDSGVLQSFEITGGKAAGDLLSQRRGDKALTVGLLACAYFEYWRMYDSLRAQVAADMQQIADRLGRAHTVIYPGLVETLDGADAAGRRFCDEQIDVGPACENWGFQGKSLGFEATYEPGPVTMTHAIHDAEGWRLLVSKGQLLDTEPLQINESFMIVGVGKPVKDYIKQLIQYGFSHHFIVASGDVTEHLECLARQIGMQVCWL